MYSASLPFHGGRDCERVSENQSDGPPRGLICVRIYCQIELGLQLEVEDGHWHLKTTNTLIPRYVALIRYLLPSSISNRNWMLETIEVQYAECLGIPLPMALEVLRAHLTNSLLVKRQLRIEAIHPHLTNRSPRSHL